MILFSQPAPPGCPSERVAANGNDEHLFGAALMRTPDRVARLCSAMQKAATHLPVSVKCRIGIDSEDSYEFVRRFVEVVSKDGGVEHFIVHARKAILKGISSVSLFVRPVSLYLEFANEQQV